MPYKEEEYVMPCGVESAVHRLGSAAVRDGMDIFNVFYKHGVPDSVTFYEHDGTTRLVALLDGEWHEYVEVGGGDD